jgi:hypothetical protein
MAWLLKVGGGQVHVCDPQESSGGEEDAPDADGTQAKAASSKVFGNDFIRQFRL